MDLVLPSASLMQHWRNWDMTVVEVPTTAWHALIRPRDRPVLLEQSVGEFHRHVPAVAWSFLLLGARGPGLAIVIHLAERPALSHGDVGGD
jgi:hypothetical protein